MNHSQLIAWFVPNFESFGILEFDNIDTDHEENDDEDDEYEVDERTLDNDYYNIQGAESEVQFGSLTMRRRMWVDAAAIARV